jgi:REP element-mobilizing transposase RayT
MVMRPLRVLYPGAVYHVTARGNERRTIFQDAGDYLQFLLQLELAIARYG